MIGDASELLQRSATGRKRRGRRSATGKNVDLLQVEDAVSTRQSDFNLLSCARARHREQCRVGRTAIVVAALPGDGATRALPRSADQPQLKGAEATLVVRTIVDLNVGHLVRVAHVDAQPWVRFSVGVAAAASRLLCRNIVDAYRRRKT